MKGSIRTYIESIASDNAEYINNSVAEYIIENAEQTDGWAEFFDISELEENQGEPTDEQIEELKEYLRDNF